MSDFKLGRRGFLRAGLAVVATPLVASCAVKPSTIKATVDIAKKVRAAENPEAAAAEVVTNTAKGAAESTVSGVQEEAEIAVELMNDAKNSDLTEKAVNAAKGIGAGATDKAGAAKDAACNSKWAAIRKPAELAGLCK